MADITPAPKGQGRAAPPRPTQPTQAQPARAQPTQAQPARARTRDPRLDVFRGLALITIFINHMPGTVFEDYTSRNFGFSDAAEAFVLMSGVAAGIAYAPGLLRRPLWPGLAHVWGRSWTLYLVHLFVTFWVMAVVAAGALWLDVTALLGKNNFGPVFQKPLDVMVGLPTLGHQFGYVNILPMYAVLLLGAPVMVWIAAWRKWAALAVSISIWVLAGQFRLNLPNYPNAGGWFFNPISWQLIFTVGLLTGMSLREGKRFVPRRGWLQALSGGFLVLALVWMKWDPMSSYMNRTLHAAYKAGVPFYLAGFDKTYLALPRLLHILALAYFLSSFGVVRRVCAMRWLEPVSVMGRQALPVFAFGTILSLTGQVLKGAFPPAWQLDAGLIAGGIVVLWALAVLRERARIRPAKPATAAPAPAATSPDSVAQAAA
ncbi:OpgC family protein [Phaeovulum vinaykumarii]|uniref:OpgC protein n=1 Tax=Phaeovulum vinaykumarii TaxID=407234 RepID=A0A1N7M1Q8_9RHOB|nr:OpgC domain-containing protein [Phaeovulum vinaykumarii]SIS79993.1 hypothetical protein SAMN05421795_10565 [Phaeovulum vinaykumarii]SOC09457.1 hypothetical protein SAMN05878426_105137 [Phaeovulum vinaykumarii]